MNLFFELSGSLVQYIGMRNITENKFSKQIKYGMMYIGLIYLCLPFERRETYCFSLIFFFCFRFFCFFSAKLVRTITFLSFQKGQLYLVCGCMTIRRCVAYCNDLCGTLTSRSNNCFLNSIFLYGP